MPGDKNYSSSLRGGSTISPAGYKKQFLSLDSGARKEIFSKISLCLRLHQRLLTCKPKRSTYAHTPLVCSFSHNSGFRYANCNVHRFKPMTFNVGSLADGVLAVAPEARLWDSKTGNLTHRRVSCCDHALGGLIRSSLCAPKSPSCLETCATGRIVDGSAPPYVSKPLRVYCSDRARPY